MQLVCVSRDLLRPRGGLHRGAPNLSASERASADTAAQRRQEALRAGSESGDDVPTRRVVDEARPTASEARTSCAPDSPVTDFLQPAQSTPPVPSSSVVAPSSRASPNTPSTEPAAVVPSLPASFPFTFNPFESALNPPDVRSCAGSSSKSQRRRGGRGNKDKARLASTERIFHAPPPPTAVEVDSSGGGPGYNHYVPLTLLPDVNGKRRLDLSPSRHRRDRTADAAMDEAEPEERSSKRWARTG